jgi:multidrug efflux system membrane fusion protein
VLGYTKIVAPISGRTGLRLVDMGNIVRMSDAAGIVMITQLRPISILFSLPQQQLARVNKAFAQGPLTVEALGPDSKTVIDRGTLQVVDNLVDQTTGTVRLKAEFPNADLQLWPGQFVNVRLLIETMRDVVVVPTASVQRGPSGTFVYVIEDNKAAVRPVTVVQQDDVQTVVATGLQPPERVVTTGFARLSEGSAVTIGSADTSPPPPPPGSERPRRRRGEGAPGAAPRDDNRRGQQRSEAAPVRSAP